MTFRTFDQKTRRKEQSPSSVFDTLISAALFLLPPYFVR